MVSQAHSQAQFVVQETGVEALTAPSSVPFGSPARASDAQKHTMYVQGVHVAQQQQQLADPRYLTPELHQAGMPQYPPIQPQPAAAGHRRIAVPANFPDHAPQMPNSVANPTGQQQHAPQTAHQLTCRDFEPIRKENKQLTKFDGNMVHYKRWAGRVTDHLAKGRRK